MANRIARPTLTLAVPLALALAVPAARAEQAKEIPNPPSVTKTATKTATTTKGGKTATQDAAATTQDDGTQLAHSIANWHPELGTTPSTQTPAAPMPTPHHKIRHQQN